MIEDGDNRTQTYMLVVSPLFQLRPPVHRIVIAALPTGGRAQYCLGRCRGLELDAGSSRQIWSWDAVDAVIT